MHVDRDLNKTNSFWWNYICICTGCFKTSHPRFIEMWRLIRMTEIHLKAYRARQLFKKKSLSLIYFLVCIFKISSFVFEKNNKKLNFVQDSYLKRWRFKKSFDISENEILPLILPIWLHCQSITNARDENTRYWHILFCTFFIIIKFCIWQQIIYKLWSSYQKIGSASQKGKFR